MIPSYLFVHFCGCCRMKLQILVIKIKRDAQGKQVRQSQVLNAGIWVVG